MTTADLEPTRRDQRGGSPRPASTRWLRTAVALAAVTAVCADCGSGRLPTDSAQALPAQTVTQLVTKQADAVTTTVTAPATRVTKAETVTATKPGPTVTKAGPTVTKQVIAQPETVTVTATVAPEVSSPAAVIPGDGTYAVGVDVQPGTYVSKAPLINCYWARLGGNSGAIDDIIDNNNSAGQSVVTISSSDKYFETSGCSTWTRR